MSTLSLVDGSVFAERYRIVRCIAAGGMGAVYEVLHLETNRRRALKVMLPHFLQSEELKDRFRQEARVAADIESEFIVDVFDAGVDPHTQMPFLVMELLRGEELGKLLRERGRFTPAEVVTYLHQVALALDKTHRAQIVHRDLKPENIFLTHREDGAPRIKVLDFGVAKVVAESNTNVNATRSLGTPIYMAPEQFRTGHQVSPATDLYALAMMVFTLLVGRAYWNEEAQQSGGNVFAFAEAVKAGPQEPATRRAHRAGVPLSAAFDGWFARAAAYAPEQRFPSATAMIAALADALGVQRPGLESSGPLSLAGRSSHAGEIGASAITGPALGSPPEPRRRGVGAAVAVVAALATTAVVAAAIVLSGRVQPSGREPAASPSAALLDPTEARPTAQATADTEPRVPVGAPPAVTPAAATGGAPRLGASSPATSSAAVAASIAGGVKLMPTGSTPRGAGSASPASRAPAAKKSSLHARD